MKRGHRPAQSAVTHELEVAQRWWALAPGSALPASDGATYTLLFAGVPGGAAGPDVRDAVFAVSYRPLLARIQRQSLTSVQMVGDVEFHVRSDGWIAHGHDCDVRYNGVVLHVVFNISAGQSTRRQDGVEVPVCCLRDVLPVGDWPLPPTVLSQEATWPCHTVMMQLEAFQIEQILRQAGQLRFEQKVEGLIEAIHAGMAQSGVDEEFGLYDQCLIVAVAEGLGYGRDRLFFRAAGLALLRLSASLPEPLGKGSSPAPLDARRLRVLGQLVATWRLAGAWKSLQAIVCGGEEQPEAETLRLLRAMFIAAGLSVARADILICNVLLPFVAAVGLIEQHALWYQHALHLYLSHPGLGSNRVTRLMCAQLGLQALPQGSCQQQGLHYIYQQTCREKRCAQCILGRRVL